MRPFRKYSATLFVLGLGVALFAGGYAYATGKPPKPPAPPIDPAIVYATNGSLAIANADGTNQKTILSNVGGYVSPSWSPDGNLIVFVASDGNTSNGLSGRGIYRISIDRVTGQATGPATKLASLNSLIMANPVWSPVPIQDSVGVSRYFIAYSDVSFPQCKRL